MRKSFLFLMAVFITTIIQAQTLRLNRAQAVADIDTLIYTLNEVHPNMFSVCNQGDYLRAVYKVKNALPDSLSKVEFYKRIAPLISMIGDGHTIIGFPYEIFNDSTMLRMPMFLDVDSNDSTMHVNACIDGIVPIGAKVLSINGNSYKSIVKNMMRYESGEQPFFRLYKLSYSNTALFQILYFADKYKVKYEYNGKVSEAVLKALSRDCYKNRLVKKKIDNKSETSEYSFRILDGKSIAVMDFNVFRNEKRFQAFADSMFTALNKKHIKNLIIDIRRNGGGVSSIGDELFQYISPVAFQQFGRSIMRITPMTQKLLHEKASLGLWYNEDPLIQLRSNPLRFNGKVFLLISHYTFSSAASFSWAFKYFKMGTVIGEESGGMNVCFGDMLSFRLPNSNLALGISYKRFWQYGANEQDIHGTIPDYKVPQKDALDYTLKLLVGR
jgi:hypothetical protein